MTPRILLSVVLPCFITGFVFAAEPSPEVYKKYSAEVVANLQKEVLDKWFPVAADAENGGFFENFKENWSRGRTGEKSLVYQSRLTWLSAQAAVRFPDKSAEYLAMTRRGVSELADKLWDKEHGGFFWTVDDNGKPTRELGGEKHVYGIAFAIYASAASYSVTKDAAALDLAKRGFKWLDEHAHDAKNGGYYEALTVDGQPILQNADRAGDAIGTKYGRKSMNSHIHLLEAMAGFYAAWPDPAVKARLEELHGVILDKIYAEPGIQHMFLSPDWQPVLEPDSFGHDIETAFLLVESAEMLGKGEDAKTWQAARHLVDHALSVGFDHERGGFYNEGTVQGKDLDTKKIWWVEAEGLNALLLMHERFGKETTQYWKAFEKQWAFISKHQVDAKFGGWLNTVNADGLANPGRAKSDRWTECYHQGRALLEVSARLNRLAASVPVGIFEGKGDVGVVLHEGSVEFDEAKKAYTIAGSGENMWAAKDAFQFVWKKGAGDLAISADASFLGAGTDPHRKACLMIRQSLEADSAYVDVALHGDGLTSLQFRDAKGAATHEVQANIKAPAKLRLEKRGKYALMYLAAEGQEMSFSGAAVRIALEEPFYVGLGVCAHNKNLIEKAVFSNVEIQSESPAAARKPVLYSTLETQTIASTDRRVTLVIPGRIEAPNWLHDNQTLIYNSGGKIYRVPALGGKPEQIDTGFAIRCNNDHGVSLDGNTLAISDQSQTKDGKRPSLIYTLPIGGGTPKLITPTGPSYWHGWSPDGKTLAFCGERGGEFDIYTIAADGSGEEKRLTAAKGLDDGPEFSPDGKSIYFNSDRTGLMQIWRMKSDGSEQEQVTDDQQHNWFPHLSPDGKRMVFLTYEKDVKGHPEDKDVTLRMMTLESKRIDVLGKIFGGQGTINVPCWSSDGRRIAFVTYQLIPQIEKQERSDD